MRGQVSNDDENKKKKKMKNGIIQRSDGSWTFVVPLPRDPETGKPRQKWETVRGTRKNAERRRREVLGQMDHGLYSLAPSKMTLSEFRDYYLAIARGKRENTYRGYVRAFKAFNKCLGDSLPISELRTDMVQRAVNELSSRLKKSTVGVYFTYFKTTIKYAASPGVMYLLINPCDGVIVNKPDAAEKAVWDDDQANKFIRFCKFATLRYATLFMLLLTTGARIGEILALRWTDVDFKQSTIHITRTVAGKGYNPPKSKNGVRKIPLDGGTVKQLSRHKVLQGREKLLNGEGYNPENLVFCTSDGWRTAYMVAWESFASITKKSGLPNITPHGLRHTHATYLLRHGHSCKVVAERLGDTEKSIMDTYSHVVLDIQAEAVRTIERLHE